MTARTLSIAHLTNAELDEYYLHGWRDDMSLPTVRNAPDGLHGFALWFDVYFTRDGNLSEAQNAKDAAARGIEVLTTGPQAKPTHWEQTFLPCVAVKEVQSLHEGDVTRVSLRLKPPTADPRGLDVDVKWEITRDGAESTDPKKERRQAWTLCGYSIT